MVSPSFARLTAVATLLLSCACTPAAALSGGDPRVAECLDFLRTNAPPTDAHLTDAFLLNNTLLALEARDASPWASAVPWEIFLNDVLPYAIMSEPRAAWRKEFRDKVAPMVTSATSLENATLEVAAQLWDAWGPPTIKFHAAPPNEVNAYDPLAVAAAHNASCTGLSIFFASALRSVGIPSRVAGVPHWNLGPTTCPHGDADESCSNHDWDEVWFDGRWSFFDTTATHKAFNQSWFFPGHIAQQVPATLPDPVGTSGGNHSVWASSFRNTTKEGSSRFPMVWDWDYYLPGVDVTERYVRHHASHDEMSERTT